MPVLFDTSVAIALRDGDLNVLSRAERIGSVPLLSIISVVELEGGVARAKQGQATRRAALDALYEAFDVLTFGTPEAAQYGRIVLELGFSRAQVFDRMIAAQAISAGAAVATLNARDFNLIPDLQVEDWTQ